MKSALSFSLVVVAAMVLFAVGVCAQEAASKTALQQMYMSHLTEEGFRPEIDGDGDVAFRREGRSYFIAVSEQDPGFFTVVLPNIWPIESEQERAQVLIAVDRATAVTKVAKAYTLGDNVWIAVELFVSAPEDFKGVLARSLHSIDEAVRTFVSTMQELASE